MSMKRVETLEREPGIVISLWGDVKTGKSFTAANAPGKLYYHEFDQGGWSRIAPHLSDERLKVGVFRETYPLDQHTTVTQKTGLWNTFLENIQWSVKEAKDGAGFVIIDTETILWDIMQAALVPENGKRGAMEYGKANGQYRGIIGGARKYHANLIFIHQARPVWAQNENNQWIETGQLEAQSMKENKGLVDVRIQTLKPVAGAGKTDFRAKIEFCGLDPKLEGVVFDPSGKSLGVAADKLMKLEPTIENILMILGVG
jgi:hypothetical protein